MARKLKRFCNDNCRQGFAADRRHGAVYPAVLCCGKEHAHVNRYRADGGCYETWEETCYALRACAYCRAGLEGK